MTKINECPNCKKLGAPELSHGPDSSYIRCCRCGMRGPEVEHDGIARFTGYHKQKIIALWNSLSSRQPACHDPAPILVSDVREAMLAGYGDPVLDRCMCDDGDHGDTLARYLANEYDGCFGHCECDERTPDDALVDLIHCIAVAEEQLHSVLEELRKLEAGRA